MPQTKVPVKFKTHILYYNFFPKIVPFMRYCGKILFNEQATDDNMADAHCLLDT